MASFEVRWRKSALADIRRIAKANRPASQRIQKAINGLAVTPFPRNSKKLVNSEAYRLRVGSYRVFYTLDGRARVIVVEEVSPRSQAYRG